MTDRKDVTLLKGADMDIGYGFIEPNQSKDNNLFKL